MHMISISVRTLAVLCLFGCNESPLTKGEPKPASASGAPAPVTAAPGAPLQLTDDKLTRFAVYQREMLPVMGQAMNAAGSAFAKSGSDARKFGDEMAGGEQGRNIAKVSEAALAKSGLTQAEVSELSRLTSEYYGQAMVTAEMKKALASPSEAEEMKDFYRKQLEEFEVYKRDYAQKHGAATLALLEKHSDEFVALTHEMLNAMVTRPKK